MTFNQKVVWLGIKQKQLKVEMLSVEKLEKFAFDWCGASTEMEKQLTECFG